MGKKIYVLEQESKNIKLFCQLNCALKIGKKADPP